MNKSPRSESILNITSYGMKTILNEVMKQPGVPFGIYEIKEKHNLNRHDIINARRQITRIDRLKGSIRYIEPARTHIVFITDDIKNEHEIDAILSAGAAIAHISKKYSGWAANLQENLSHSIHQMIVISKK